MRFSDLIKTNEEQPKTSEDMMNLLLINALAIADSNSRNAEFWERKYKELQKFFRSLKPRLEMKKMSNGTCYINIESIYEQYDKELYIDAIAAFDLAEEELKLKGEIKE